MLVEKSQFIPGPDQFKVFLDCCFVGGKKQIEDLLSFRSDEVLLTCKEDFNPHLHFIALVQLTIDQNVLDTREKVVLVIRLGDEVVCSTLQSFDNIHRVRKRS